MVFTTKIILWIAAAIGKSTYYEARAALQNLYTGQIKSAQKLPQKSLSSKSYRVGEVIFCFGFHTVPNLCFITGVCFPWAVNSGLPRPEIQQHCFILYASGTEDHENKHFVYIQFLYNQQEDLKSRVGDLHIFVRYLLMQSKQITRV